MDHNQSGIGPKDADEESTLVAESRSLQRKLKFWRRAAWLLVGMVLVVAAMAWKRADTHRHNCCLALERCADLAQAAQLDKEPPTLVKEQWRGLGRDSIKGPAAAFRPDHYLLIIQNWGQAPMPGESLPLAVCSSPHLVLFSYGRHVLVRDTDGYHVVWYDENRAAPIVSMAREEEQKK